MAGCSTGTGHQAEPLVGVGARVMVKALNAAILPTQAQVIEAGNGQATLRVARTLEPALLQGGSFREQLRE